MLENMNKQLFEKIKWTHDYNVQLNVHNQKQLGKVMNALAKSTDKKVNRVGTKLTSTMSTMTRTSTTTITATATLGLNFRASASGGPPPAAKGDKAAAMGRGPPADQTACG